VTEPLHAGVYESLRTPRLDAQLGLLGDLVPHFADVEDADQAHVLARHVAAVVQRALREQPDGAGRRALVNDVLTVVSAHDEHLADAVQHLVVLSREIAPGVHKLERPVTPLSSAALLTNTRGEPSLSAELRSELASADSVDLLCAFIRWHGVRVLADQLELLREREVPFRVITTTYMGATEQRAVDELVRRYRATMKINYASASTRLHAKAWLFRRRSGFDTAFVGSSNLSKSALVDGGPAHRGQGQDGGQQHHEHPDDADHEDHQPPTGCGEPEQREREQRGELDRQVGAGGHRGSSRRV